MIDRPLYQVMQSHAVKVCVHHKENHQDAHTFGDSVAWQSLTTTLSEEKVYQLLRTITSISYISSCVKGEDTSYNKEVT